MQDVFFKDLAEQGEAGCGREFRGLPNPGVRNHSLNAIRKMTYEAKSILLLDGMIRILKMEMFICVRQIVEALWCQPNFWKYKRKILL